MPSITRSIRSKQVAWHGKIVEKQAQTSNNIGRCETCLSQCKSSIYCNHSKPCKHATEVQREFCVRDQREKNTRAPSDEKSIQRILFALTGDSSACVPEIAFHLSRRLHAFISEVIVVATSVRCVCLWRLSVSVLFCVSVIVNYLDPPSNGCVPISCARSVLL